MAGVLVGGAIQTTFAALSFAGAGFLFSKLNHTGYEAEIKRHNHALEQLAESKNKFYENEIKRKDQLAELRAELSDANADINQTNKALDLLRRINQLSADDNNTVPQLSNFYSPSEEMKQYQTVVLLGTGLTAGYLIHRFTPLKKWV